MIRRLWWRAWDRRYKPARLFLAGSICSLISMSLFAIGQAPILFLGCVGLFFMNAFAFAATREIINGQRRVRIATRLGHRHARYWVRKRIAEIKQSRAEVKQCENSSFTTV